jgi:hypothetical protein
MDRHAFCTRKCYKKSARNELGTGLNTLLKVRHTSAELQCRLSDTSIVAYLEQMDLLDRHFL